MDNERDRDPIVNPDRAPIGIPKSFNPFNPIKRMDSE